MQFSAFRHHIRAVLFLFGIVAVLSGCQTSGSDQEFSMARKAGFNETTGAALPLDPQEQDEVERKRVLQGETDGRAHMATQEAWNTARYAVLPMAPSQRPAAGTDEAGIWQVLDKQEQKIRSSNRRILDPVLNEYVSDIACRVAGAYCSDMRVYLLNVPELNASMAPNGMMSIWSGLLIRVTSEAELANVIGHEVGHYLLRHGLLSLRRQVDMQTGGLIVGVLAGMGGIQGLGDLYTVLALSSAFQYSRDAERQSDGYGYTLMVRAGYDPSEAPAIWGYLTDEIEAMGGEDTHFFGRTHPVNREREQMGYVLAEELIREAGQELTTGKDRYIATLLPYRGQFLQDELSKHQFPAFQVLLDKWRDVGVNNGEIEFFQGELYRLRADEDENDIQNALWVYESALHLPGAPNVIHRSMALIFQKLERNAEARSAFETYLALNPDAPDRALIELMIKDLTT